MAKRVQITGEIQPQGLQPQARPVDTYYQPQEKPVAPPPKTNSLLQLAESLQSIQPGLDRFIANRDKQVTEKQKVEAETMAGQLALQNQSDWSSSIQSVRKKLSDPNLAPIERERLSKQLQLFQSSNPWLRIYFDKAQLGQKALEFDQSVRTEWANNPVRDSDNPADFDTFFEERLNKVFESIQSKYHTRAFAEDFFPQAQKTRDALLNEHINYRQKQVIENAKNAFSSLATTKLNGFREALQTTLVDRALAIGEIETLDGNQKLEMFQKDRDALYQQWADDLSNEAKKAIQMTGGSGTEMNAILADSIIAVASETKNPKILDLAKYITTRDKAKLSDIADIKAKLNDARRAINSERFTDVQREDALEERDRKEFLRKAQVEIFDKLHGDPWQDISKYRQDFNEKQMADEFLEILQVQRKLQEQRRNPIPQGRGGTADVGNYVYGGGTDIGKVNRAFLNNDITDDEYRQYGQTVNINRDRELRDSGLSQLKKELTETAVQNAIDKYKLNLSSFAANRAERTKSRNIQVETEVRRSIDSWIREQEKKNLSPSRDELNDYLWNKLFPRLDKQFGASPQSGTQKPSQNTSLTPERGKQMIQEINRSTLTPQRKQQAIQAIQKRIK
ncbi:MAG: hypothetical protein AB7P76_11285 [Candidatus Melainabacteria bacterium]